MKISIILPVYNPIDGWAGTVLSKSRELRSRYQDVLFEVIVVSDGSDNGCYTKEKSQLSGSDIRLIEYPVNKGKGEALRTGVKASSGALILYTDIDFPYTIESVCSIIDILRSGRADVAIGIKDSAYYDHVPAVRRLISRIFRSFIRMLFRIPTDDTQCGLKGFDEKGKDIFLRTTIDRYLFDLEFVFLASRQKDIALQTQEIYLREDVRFSRMNFGIIRNEMWNFIKILLRSYR